MVRHIRVRMGQERATKLLREWSDKKRKVALGIVVGRKFSITFTEGRLEQLGNIGIFQYIASGVCIMVPPGNFKCWEREETNDFEYLIFSDPEGEDRMIVMRLKENGPFPATELSRWPN